MVCQEEDRKGTKHRVMCKIGERDVTVRQVREGTLYVMRARREGYVWLKMGGTVGVRQEH